VIFSAFFAPVFHEISAAGKGKMLPFPAAFLFYKLLKKITISVKYVSIERGNPQKPEEPPKWYDTTGNLPVDYTPSGFKKTISDLQ
jgi:hypothetical protein